jgi:hypothetical protein
VPRNSQYGNSSIGESPRSQGQVRARFRNETDRVGGPPLPDTQGERGVTSCNRLKRALAALLVRTGNTEVQGHVL